MNGSDPVWVVSVAETSAHCEEPEPDPVDEPAAEDELVELDPDEQLPEVVPLPLGVRDAVTLLTPG